MGRWGGIWGVGVLVGTLGECFILGGLRGERSRGMSEVYLRLCICLQMGYVQSKKKNKYVSKQKFPA